LKPRRWLTRYVVPVAPTPKSDSAVSRAPSVLSPHPLPFGFRGTSTWRSIKCVGGKYPAGSRPSSLANAGKMFKSGSSSLGAIVSRKYCARSTVSHPKRDTRVPFCRAARSSTGIR
jgi:hypothetical protein